MKEAYIYWYILLLFHFEKVVLFIVISTIKLILYIFFKIQKPVSNNCAGNEAFLFPFK